MNLKVIGTGSKGNCYLLENEKEALLIECGVRMDLIKQGLRFNLSKVRGCILTHDHLDHSKSVSDMLKAGITVHASRATLQATFNIGHHRARPIDIPAGEDYGDQFYVGNFRVIPFRVQHDAHDPLGFLINHPETGTILFVTDTYYVKQTFRGLNNVIVEANFCQSILDQRLANGENPEFLRNRIFKSHMSLATCKDLLRANDLSQVNNIVLIHLSDCNSHADRFKKEVTEATGKMVHIASPGLSIPFSKKPF